MIWVTETWCGWVAALVTESYTLEAFGETRQYALDRLEVCRRMWPEKRPA